MKPILGEGRAARVAEKWCQSLSEPFLKPQSTGLQLYKLKKPLYCLGLFELGSVFFATHCWRPNDEATYHEIWAGYFTL